MGWGRGAYLANTGLTESRGGGFTHATRRRGFGAGGGAVVHLALLFDAGGGERGGLGEFLAFCADHRGRLFGDV